MKISILRTKENFNQVFASSLSRYLWSRYQWRVDISWQPSPNKTCFIVNDQLNVIYPNAIKRSLLAPIIAEYIWHQHPIRHWLQKLYVYCSVRIPWQHALKSGVCHITQDRNDHEIKNHPLCEQQHLLDNVVFVPGNHSHRLININHNISTVFCKIGADPQLTMTDAQIRLQHSDLNVPKILDHNFDQGWYDEERVIALPLNRLGDRVQQATIVNKCQLNLRRLYDKQRQQFSVVDYTRQLTNNILQLTTQFAGANVDFSLVQASTEKITQLLGNQGLRHVSLVITHGDFQPANILCNQDDFWIIDWEYASQRTLFYDALVFALKARITADFSSRLCLFKQTIEDDGVFFQWCGESLQQENSYYLYLFLLEDITLKLNEITANDNSKSNANITRYFQEVFHFLSPLP